MPSVFPFLRLYALTSVSVLAPLCAERLVLFPMLERSFNAAGIPSGFGQWTWAYSIVLFVSLSVAQGSSYCILRHCGGKSEGERWRIFSLARTHLRRVGGPGMVASAIYVCFSSDYHVAARIWPLLLLAVLLAWYQGQALVLGALLRVEGKLEGLFFAAVGFSTVLAIGTVLIAHARPLEDDWMCWMLGCGCAATVAGVWRLARSCRIRGRAIAEGAVTPGVKLNKDPLRSDSGYASLVYIGDHSLTYLPRFFLGELGGMYSVGVFVASSSMAALFLAPVMLAGTVIMTVLSGMAEVEFRGRAKWGYFLAVLGVGLIVGIVTYFLLPGAMTYFYPSMHSEADLVRLPLAVAAVGMASTALIRPMVLKVRGIHRVVLLSLAVTAFTGAACVAFCGQGLVASLWVYAGGTVAVLSVWLGFALLVRSGPTRAPTTTAV